MSTVFDSYRQMTLEAFDPEHTKKSKELEAQHRAADDHARHASGVANLHQGSDSAKLHKAAADAHRAAGEAAQKVIAHHRTNPNSHHVAMHGGSYHEAARWHAKQAEDHDVQAGT